MPPGGPTVRPAEAADGPALDRLWRELGRLHARLHPGYFAADGMERPVRPPPGGITLVALVDGALAGGLRARIARPAADPQVVPGLRCSVEELVVAPAVRRRGVGRALMAAVEAWARRQGAASVVLTVWAGNRAAAAFYEALGYGELSRVLERRLT